MTIHADSCFHIGSTHAVCEDYATTGLDSRDEPFVLLSDGCSSSDHTDFGSRFLVRAACQTLVEENRLNLSRLLWTARGFAQQLQLPIGCLDATLGCLRPLDANISAMLIGDGVIAARHRETGRIDHIEVSFSRIPIGSTEGVAPGYLSYMLSPTRLQGFLDIGGGVRKATFFQDGAWIKEEVTSLGLENDASFLFHHMFPRSEYDFIVIASDGIESFFYRGERGEPIPVAAHEILKVLMGFKPRGGVFLVRAHRGLSRKSKANGWQHYDDLALGGLLDPEGVEEP